MMRQTSNNRSLLGEQGVRAGTLHPSRAGSTCPSPGWAGVACSGANPRLVACHRRRGRTAQRSGFTLAELLVSLTLMALLTASIVSATRALTATRTRVDEHIAASAAARQGLEAVVAALRNVRRDPDRDHPLIIGESGDGGNSRLALQVISDIKARADSPESDQYEVGFTVWQRDDGVPVLLCRRNNGLTDKPGMGGIATVVAEGIVGLSCEYYSQGQWQNEWTEAELGVPEAVRVTVAATGVPARRATGARISPAVFSTIVAIHAEQPEDVGPQGQEGKQQGQAGQGKSGQSGQSNNASGVRGGE